MMFNTKLKAKTYKMRRQPTSLTEEIAITDGPIFYVSRFLGLAPCSIEKKDRKISFNLSAIFCIYSFTVATFGGINKELSELLSKH